MVVTLCLLPTLMLYRYTVCRIYVGRRAFLQSVIWGGWVVFLVPSILLDVTGITIFSIVDQPLWKLAIFLPAMGAAMILGYWALYHFAIYGKGTPIPFDPPQKLVTSGPYAYIGNPLQLSTVLMFGCLAFLYESPYLLMGMMTMVIFAETFVRWHHMIDIEQRFGEDWHGYRQNVRNWWPRRNAYGVSE